MKPLTTKQLRDALDDADGVCSYQIETSLDVDNALTTMDINGLIDNSRLKYKEIVTATNDCSERKADGKNRSVTLPSQYSYISPELNEHGVMKMQYADFIGMEITKTGIKNRHVNKHYVRFKNYKNTDDLIAALLPKIRKALQIQSVF